MTKKHLLTRHLRKSHTATKETERTRSKPIHQDELLSLQGSFVVLGEAGAGKTELLKWVADNSEYTYCTASRLITTPQPLRLLGSSNVLIIDALDELSTNLDGDSVRQVITKLAEANYPKFILACRVADWRSASSMALINEHYQGGVTEYFLLPFGDDEAQSYLVERFGKKKADYIQQHLSMHDLKNLLGNPQTLQMIVKIADQTNQLPVNRAELFQEVVHVLLSEHRNEKAELQPSKEDKWDVAGAICALLLLTGNEAITRRSTENEDKLLLTSELTQFVGRDMLNAVLDTRLFVVSEADCFNYIHRSIAEFLGADWLINQCSNERQRNRLLNILQYDGGVPSSLRGLHSWLAKNSNFEKSIIQADPIGFIEYGDTSALSLENSKHLLSELQVAMSDSPYVRFDDDQYFPVFLRAELRERVVQLVTNKETPFSLRKLLLQTIGYDGFNSIFQSKLEHIICDQEEAYGIRFSACKALVIKNRDDEHCLKIINKVEKLQDEDSLRLLLEIMPYLNYQLFTDQQIADYAHQYATINNRVIGPLFPLENNLPRDRIPSVLNALSSKLGPHNYNRDHDFASSITNFSYKLIARYLQQNDVSASQLWGWLEPYCQDDGYYQEEKQIISQYLIGNDEKRREVQSLVIFSDTGNSFFNASHRLVNSATGLKITESDAIALLNQLDPTKASDKSWKEIVQLVFHSKKEGVALRQAAHKFAKNNEKDLAWLYGLGYPVRSSCQIRSKLRQLKHQAKTKSRLSEVAKSYLPVVEDMKNGSIESLIDPAIAYVGWDRRLRSKTPSERVVEMFGNELGAVALEGFQKTLQNPELFPSLDEIVTSLLNKKVLYATVVLVAGLVEYIKAGKELCGLSDDCILKCFVAIYETVFSSRDLGIDSLQEVIVTEVMQRGIWKKGICLRIEPKIEQQADSLTELYDVMRNSLYQEQATELAIEWLDRFLKIPLMAEKEIIDRLLRSEKKDYLQGMWLSRSQSSVGEQKRLWLAVGIITNFEQASALLNVQEVDSELLWALRDFLRARGTQSHNELIKLTVTQMAWIVRTFRVVWPSVPRPEGVTGGDTNAWDAHRFIEGLITKLSADISTKARWALTELYEIPKDSYTNQIRYAISEQQRAFVESKYRPLALSEIRAIVNDQQPVSIKDLQTFMMEELKLVQRKIRSDDVDSWRGFFDSSEEPHDEERCRDYLLGLLRQNVRGIHLVPEAHVASDKRVDITCSVLGVDGNNLRLPIEIKGQWHRELWTAADEQLDKLYTTDWMAQGHGIYLVLWFGENVCGNKKLKPPLTLPKPSSSEELHSALYSHSKAAKSGRVSIFVLDLER